MWGRWVMAAGGVFALLLTPPFALSYFSAYPMPNEAPPNWLAALRPRLTAAGLLDAGSAAAYDRYGLLYLAAWLIGIVGLAGVLRSQWARFSRPLRRVWLVAVGCLLVVAVGIFGDYGLPDDVGSQSGFALTGIGLLAAAVAFPFVGRALRREFRVSLPVVWGIGALGAVSMIGGFLLVRHIPSGPCLGYVVVGVVAGLTHPWKAARAAG